MRDSWSLRFFGLLGLFATTAPAMAGAPYLVSDIDPVPITAGSQIGILAALDNGLTLFSPADDESGAGRELWVSDGSEGGTLRLTDACPGPCSSNPGLVAANGLWALLALGNAQTGQTDLWLSRGTAASTVKVATGVTATPFFRYRFVWSADRRIVFFLASRPTTGMELWKSDGTPAGTALVRDIEPGPGETKLGEMLFLNGRLYFGAIDSRRGAALWTSDGTPAGTLPLKVVTSPPAVTLDRPFFLTAVGRLLYFVARPAGGRSREVWRTDGTVSGTFPVSSFSPTSPDTRIQGIVAAGGKAYILGMYSSRRGQELFVSDGKPRSTRQLTSFQPETPFFDQFLSQEFLHERSVALGTRLVFWANDGIHGEELWVADPAAPQARLLADLCPGPCSSTPFVVGIVAGRLFLNAGDTATGRELWVTDGTAAGTRLVRDVCPGSCSSGARGIAIFGNRFFFRADDGQIGHELYVTDGTPAGTRLVQDFCPGPCDSNAEWFLGQVPGGFLAGVRETGEARDRHDALFRIGPQGDALRLGDLNRTSYYFPVDAVRPQFLYTHDDGEHGQELWRTDGTPEGTRLVRDLNRRDEGGGHPTGFLSLGGQALFFVPARDEGLDLWKSDGTNGGTVLVKRLLPPPASRYFDPSWLPTLELGGRIFLSVGGTLWVTDGTAAGTARAIPDSVVNPYALAVSRGEVYFWAAQNQIPGLWKTDGTPAGTVRLAVHTGSRSPHPDTELATSGDRLFFFKDWEIWQTDGTAAGTSRLLPYEGPIYRDPQGLAFFRGALYFLAHSDEARSAALFRTDGTEAGTVQVMLLPDFASQLLVVGDRLAILGPNSLLLGDGTAAGTVAVSPSVGMRPIAWRDGVLFSVQGDLWRSDGTAAGTGPLLSSEGNRVPIHDGKFQALGSRLFFLAGDKTLWQTDGTPGGTYAVAVPEGGLPFETHRWGAAAGLVFFRGYDPSTGYELWALPPD